MNLIWSETGRYEKTEYANEAELESAILDISSTLFGADRIYLPVKRKIGAKGGLRNIPDGYLVDLSSRRPRLFVVENELSRHDHLRHIAVQILEFSLSFEAQRRAVRSILFEAVQADADATAKCERFTMEYGYRGLDHLLDMLVFESPFAALVVIDEMPERLENVLISKFQFGVEVLELAKYVNSKGERMYHFSPFLADVTSNDGTSSPDRAVQDLSEIDTLVVPAQEEGFEETFLGENRWYAVRVNGMMVPQIKHIAAYRVAPLSAITHVAPVASIEPWKDTGKSVVNFSEPARQIDPIGLVRQGRVKAPQNIRYTTWARLQAAKTLDDVW